MTTAYSNAAIHIFVKRFKQVLGNFILFPVNDAQYNSKQEQGSSKNDQQKAFPEFT
jgi:hypothetical protein